MVTLASSALAGCGTAHETALPGEGFESAYCNTARHWAVRELDNLDDSDPAAVETYWNEYLIFVETSLQQAPPAIRRAHVVHTRAVRTLITPVLEKYRFDFKRIEAKGSPSDQAVLGAPRPDDAQAQARIEAYRNEVCGYGGSPPPARVVFKVSTATKAYCAAGAAQRAGFEKVASSGFDPAAFRSYVASDSFLKSLDDQDATAPPEIEPDVRADNEWVRTRKLEVLEKFDYDLRRLLLEGSAGDLAVFTYFDPAIVRQDSRVEAYQQQLCGAG
jgi:hypothetical protein